MTNVSLISNCGKIKSEDVPMILRGHGVNHYSSVGLRTEEVPSGHLGDLSSWAPSPHTDEDKFPAQESEAASMTDR